VRYVTASLTRYGQLVYVVYDRQAERVADGVYATLADAQWAAEQRNQRAWRVLVNGTEASHV